MNFIAKQDSFDSLTAVLHKYTTAILISIPVVLSICGYIGLIYFYQSSYPTESFVQFIGISLLLTSGSSFFTLKSQRQLDHCRRNSYFSLLTLAVLGIISTIFSINITLSITGSPKRYEGILTLLSYYAIFFASSFISNRRAKQIILAVFIGTGLIQCFYAIAQHFLSNTSVFSSTAIFNALYGQTSHGFVGNPNFFGSYLVLLNGLAFAAFCFIQCRLFRWFFYLATLLFTMLSTYSNTTSSWIGMFFIVILLSLLILIYRSQTQTSDQKVCFNQALKRLVIATISSLSMFLLINFLENWKYMRGLITLSTDALNLLQQQQLQNQMGSGRGFIWKTCLALLPEYWLHGCGPDTLSVFNLTFPTNPNVIIDKAHNEFLQIAVTQGIPALLAYLSFLYFVLRCALTNFAKSHSSKNDWINYALLAAFFGYLVQSFFNISVVTVAPYFWLICGLICFSDQPQTETESPE